MGPQSAGASPGPVCYDAGGEEVTVTDCDLVLGIVDPDYFLGGRKSLNKEKAEKAVEEKIAKPLGLSNVEAAAGVYDIVNSKMSDLIRQQVVRTGHLPEEFVIYAFGGAGPVHAAGFSAELGINKIYIFPTSPVFSAFGVASADVIHTRVITCQYILPTQPEGPNERLDTIENELGEAMTAEGFKADQVEYRRFFTMRYRRQTAGVEIPLPWDRLTDARLQELLENFEKKYEELYGVGAGYTKAGIEISAIRVDAVGLVTKPELKPQPVEKGDGAQAVKGKRNVYFTRPERSVHRDPGVRQRVAQGGQRGSRPGHPGAALHHHPGAARSARDRGSVLEPGDGDLGYKDSMKRPSTRSATLATLRTNGVSNPRIRAIAVRPERSEAKSKDAISIDPRPHEDQENQMEPTAVDPIRYEMYFHRLWAIGEEGRMTLQRVTASPIVAQGGECMSSFYDAKGVMVLACSGHLRFAAATSQAIKNMMEYFEESPGFYDGDQFFFNDPYVAGSHTYDMMVIKPIFHQGELIAWTATSTHTADTGGVLRGGALEIFHEGICISGLKIVEKDEFREDVFRTLTGMCRDPQYVGLDMKAMIAGNNVCADRYLGPGGEVWRRFCRGGGPAHDRGFGGQGPGQAALVAGRHLGFPGVCHHPGPQVAHGRGPAALLHHDQEG